MKKIERLIYIDRLLYEKTEVIDDTLPSTLINVDEPILKFPARVVVKGKTYLAEQHLVIALNIQTQALLPCSICNEEVMVEIKIKQAYHTEELTAIRGKTYDYIPFLREAILLEVPFFVECMGNCPKRAQLKKYLHQKKPQLHRQEESQEDVAHFPFADLK